EDGVDRLYINQNDTADANDRIVFFKDGTNNWYAGIGFESDAVRLKTTQPSDHKAKCISGLFDVPIQLQARKSICIRFYISGSVKDPGEIKENISQVRRNLPDLFVKKRIRYGVLEKTAEIKIPDTLLQKAYRWGKYNTDWLQREVPGFGKGL